MTKRIKMTVLLIFVLFVGFVSGLYFYDLFWGWRVRVEDGQAQGFMTLLTVKEFHSAESDVRTKMGGPARGAVGDVTAGLNCIFAMRRFCPVIEITHTFDKSIFGLINALYLFNISIESFFINPSLLHLFSHNSFNF